MKHSFRQDLSAKLKADFQQDYQDIFCFSRVGHSAGHIPGYEIIRSRRARWPALQMKFRLAGTVNLPQSPDAKKYLSAYMVSPPRRNTRILIMAA